MEADVLLASGDLVTANADSHSDLFWAVRGGGGNFGIVTSFLFRLHPVSDVIAGLTLYELDQAADVLGWYREFIGQAPEDLGGWFAFLTVPPVQPFPEHLHNRRWPAGALCYAGPAELAEATLEPVHTFGPPALDGLQPMPFPAFQGMFDPFFPAGLQWEWRADFVNEISDAAIAEHCASPRRCQPACRRCTCTRSMVPRTEWIATTRRSATARLAGRRSSRASIRTLGSSRCCGIGAPDTGRRFIRIPLAART